MMPEGSINHAGLGCVKNQPDRARNIVPVKRPGPGFSAILGQIDAAMRIWGVCPPESRNEYNVGVLRVYEYVPDMFRVGESHMTPGAPGVVRSPDPVASIHRSERSARGTKIARPCSSKAPPMESPCSKSQVAQSRPPQLKHGRRETAQPGAISWRRTARD